MKKMSVIVGVLLIAGTFFVSQPSFAAMDAPGSPGGISGQSSGPAEQSGPQRSIGVQTTPLRDFGQPSERERTTVPPAGVPTVTPSERGGVELSPGGEVTPMREQPSGYYEGERGTVPRTPGAGEQPQRYEGERESTYELRESVRPPGGVEGQTSAPAEERGIQRSIGVETTPQGRYQEPGYEAPRTYQRDMETRTPVAPPRDYGETGTYERERVTRTPSVGRVTTGVVGSTVKNLQGEDLGTVKDVVVDQNGRLQYVILSSGGVMGIGDRLIPVPWNVVDKGVDPNVLIVNIDSNRLRNAPYFNEGSWPNFSDPSVNERVYGYYGVERVR